MYKMFHSWIGTVPEYAEEIKASTTDKTCWCRYLISAPGTIKAPNGPKNQ